LDGLGSLYNILNVMIVTLLLGLERQPCVYIQCTRTKPRKSVLEEYMSKEQQVSFSKVYDIQITNFAFSL